MLASFAYHSLCNLTFAHRNCSLECRMKFNALYTSILSISPEQWEIRKSNTRIKTRLFCCASCVYHTFYWKKVSCSILDSVVWFHTNFEWAYVWINKKQLCLFGKCSVNTGNLVLEMPINKVSSGLWQTISWQNFVHVHNIRPKFTFPFSFICKYTHDLLVERIGWMGEKKEAKNADLLLSGAHKNYEPQSFLKLFGKKCVQNFLINVHKC